MRQLPVLYLFWRAVLAERETARWRALFCFSGSSSAGGWKPGKSKNVNNERVSAIIKPGGA